MSTIDLDLDGPIADRLRLALQEIADRGLGDIDASSSLPRAVTPARRQWIRPATIAAALLLVLGVVAVVAAVTSDGENGTPVYVDGPQEPLRFVPTVLPDGMTAQNVQHFDIADFVQIHAQTWVRTNEAGSIDAIVEFETQNMSWQPPEQPRFVARFVSEDADCEVIVIAVRGDVSQDAIHEVQRTMDCTIDEGVAMIDVDMPPGFVRLDEPVAGRALYAELVGADGRAELEIVAPERTMSRSVLTGDPLGLDPEEVRPLVYVNPGVLVQPMERAGQRAYVWEPRPGLLAVVTSEQLSFEQLAEVVRGVREVGETEWNAWLATLPNPGMSESEETSSETETTIAPATSIPPELAPFIEASDVPWFPPVQKGSLLGVVTSELGDATCVALLTEQGRIEGGCGPAGDSYASYDVPAIGTVWFGRTVTANSSIDDVFGPGTTGWVGPIGPGALRPYLATYVPPNEVPDEGASTSASSPLQRLVEPGEQLWVAPVSSLSVARVSPLGLATRPEGDAVCVALLTVDARYEAGCHDGGASGGAWYGSQEVPGVGTVWFGLAIPQAPTMAEAFGEDIVQWAGPPLPDGRRPVLGIRPPTG